ncbi:polysaccharide export outer membrane protein [Candidatus Electrothrix aarhusensis]|uniref:Polysaccharide export outer membrane protein n=1 Tax=Candidatus Electrothrix aarhusensis TaxID=1859131 RepID=A0A3S3QE51_9BACT|nr:polysaccharide export outer membrane protein [Candidatus Electrothrix aarhusensis]
MKFVLLKQFMLLCLLLIITGCANEEIQLPIKTITSEPIIPANYLIGPSDKLEVLYYMEFGLSSTDYIIDIEDVLLVDFYYYPKISRSVTVRPDGFITLPKVGDIKAVGEEPAKLAKKISKLFSAHLAKPTVTVTLTEFNAKIKELKKTIYTTGGGQAKQIVVRPDGRISLPYLKEDSMAAGKTTVELGRELSSQYGEHIRNISITVSLMKAESFQVCIMGDVKTTGYYPLFGPTTLLQLIARAGGFTKEANIRQVVVISRGKGGKPEAAVADVEGMLKRGEPEPMIQQYDVIYVPRTSLADAAFTADAIWKFIPVRFSSNIYSPLSD